MADMWTVNVGNDKSGKKCAFIWHYAFHETENSLSWESIIGHFTVWVQGFHQPFVKIQINFGILQILKIFYVQLDKYG